MTTTTFRDAITNEAELREVIAAPRNDATWAKTIGIVDEHSRAFIALSPFILIGTCDASGHMDISPKGDPPGFVKVLDERTLAIPDRPGNGRADTFRNILENPRIGLYFLVPGKKDTLRISGSGRLVRDQWLLDEMSVQGKPAKLALIVDVEEVFFHCPKCVIRSGLWESEGWADASGLASLAKVMIDQVHLALPEEVVAKSLEKDAVENLY